MSPWLLHARLEDLINLLIDCHPQPFAVLLGEVAPPTSLEIHEMKQAQRPTERADVKNATPSATTEAERIVWDAEDVEQAVRAAYGWGHITEVCRGFREADLKTWDVVVDHTRFVGNSISRTGSQLGYVAIRYGLAPATITRYRREFPYRLARAILCPPAEAENFQLMPADRMKSAVRYNVCYRILRNTEKAANLVSCEL